mmetsp:Transcript_121160/g.247498  ORF Transcript_121160/g.247498 Transcript_121160/m.247498 type:complete len:84 (+) Transcript_121160:3825-4076(+)
MAAQEDAASLVGVAFSGQPKLLCKTYSLANRQNDKKAALSREKEISKLVKGTLTVGIPWYKVKKNFATAGTGVLLMMDRSFVQ